MSATLLPILQESVTPIAVIQGQRRMQWGTGTFFRVAEESFLVTASHVLDSAKQNKFENDLVVFNLEERTEEGRMMRPVSLAGKVNHIQHPADVAIIELDPQVVAELGGRRFLRLTDVRLAPREPGQCCVFGYPQEYTEDRPAQLMFSLDTFFMMASLSRRTTALEGYDPNRHFLLDSTLTVKHAF
jgi:hypothetical protein